MSSQEIEGKHENLFSNFGSLLIFRWLKQIWWNIGFNQMSFCCHSIFIVVEMDLGQYLVLTQSPLENNPKLLLVNLIIVIVVISIAEKKRMINTFSFFYWVESEYDIANNCGFWSNRTLPHFPLSSSVRPSVTGVTYQLFSIFWRFIPWKPYIFWMHII